MLFGDVRNLGLEQAELENSASNAETPSGSASTIQPPRGDDELLERSEVHCAKRSAQAQHSNLVKVVEKTLGDLEAGVNEAQLLTHGTNDFQGEQDLAQTRLTALQLIVKNDSNGLKEFITGITKGGRSTGEDGAAAARRLPLQGTT